jgi:Tfp pilus assembly protein PilN
MSQQINLFPSSLRPRTVPLAASTLVPVIALLVLGVAAGAVWERWRAAALERELTALRAANQDRQRELAELAQRIAARKPDAQLAAELERIEALYRSRAHAMQVLQSGVLGDPGGFSDYFRALARRTVSGLWLTGVSVGGNEVRLEGRALSAELVPRYLRQLSAEVPFQGRTFAELRIAPPKPAPATGEPAARRAPLPPFVEFVVATDPGPPGRPGEARGATQ